MIKPSKFWKALSYDFEVCFTYLTEVSDVNQNQTLPTLKFYDPPKYLSNLLDIIEEHVLNILTWKPAKNKNDVLKFKLIQVTKIL